MPLSAAAAWWFLPFVAPVALWVAYTDLSAMKITNRAVAVLLAIYAVVGLIALPLDLYLWRWTHFAALLAVGFVANMAGVMGAGDAKFIAAAAPFVALADAALVMFVFAAALLAAFATHRTIRAIPAMRRAAPGWESWQRRDFPMGLALGPTLAFYLLIAALRGFPG